LRELELDAERVLAAERERRQLADHLHDSAIQQLTLARLLLDRSGANEVLPAERVRDLLHGALAELRSLVFELSPPVLYRAGLFPALESLADRMAERWGLDIESGLVGTLPPLSEDLKVTLFQGARELLTNVGKHAQARTARLTLAVDSGGFESPRE